MTNAEAIETLRANYPDACFEQLRCAVDMAIKALEKPERKNGKWIPVTKIYKVTEGQFPNTHIEWVDATEPDEIDAVRCSECREVFDFQEARNWCTECGADMRESEDIPMEYFESGGR